MILRRVVGARLVILSLVLALAWARWKQATRPPIDPQQYVCHHCESLADLFEERPRPQVKTW